MADSKEDVASAALARLGEPAISSFEEDTETAEKVNQLYESTILDLLSSYPWQFAKARKVLTIDGGYSLPTEWARAFALPTQRTDLVGQPTKVVSSSGLNAPTFHAYEMEGAHLLTNSPVIAIEYVQRKAESLWPGYFERLAIEALAAVLALPVTEIQSKAEHHQAIAYGTASERGQGGLFGRAIQADERSRSSQGLLDDDDPIFNARFGGTGREGRW